LKASIIGTILISLLLTVGVALLFGGLKNGVQRFDARNLGMASTTMILAVVGLLIPTVFSIGVQLQVVGQLDPDFINPNLERLSLVFAMILFILYFLTLIYQLRAPKGESLQPGIDEEIEQEPKWSKRRALLILVVIAIGITILGEILSGAVEPFGEALGLSDLFMGVVVLPFAGAVSELIICTRFARANRVNLAISIPSTGAMQIALFVAPLLVMVSALGTYHLTLYFTMSEVIAVIIAVMLSAYIAIDGVTNWVEGAQFLALWLMLGVWFYFL
jgi:Ca2+:H+ antiporter